MDCIWRSSRRIAADPPHSFQQWTTASNLDDEERLQILARRLESDPSFPAPGITANAKAALANLTADQSYVVNRLLSTSSRLQIVTGPPGAGKTHLLEPVVRAHEEAYGPGSVIGAAEAWRPALALKERFGIEAYSLARLFHDKNVRKIRLARNTLLIVDEAGLISTKRMRHLLDFALSGGNKLILLGDDGQLNPIGPGSGMRLLRHTLSFDAKMELSQIIRPTDSDHERSPKAS